eukprot:6171873-Pleurochrysis_carterae.AAC.1
MSSFSHATIVCESAREGTEPKQIRNQAWQVAPGRLQGIEDGLSRSRVRRDHRRCHFDVR